MFVFIPKSKKEIIPFLNILYVFTLIILYSSNYCIVQGKKKTFSDEVEPPCQVARYTGVSVKQHTGIKD